MKTETASFRLVVCTLMVIVQMLALAGSRAALVLPVRQRRSLVG